LAPRCGTVRRDRVGAPGALIAFTGPSLPTGMGPSLPHAGKARRVIWLRFAIVLIDAQVPNLRGRARLQAIEGSRAVMQGCKTT
jgi:hypothetical protein